MTWPLVDAKDDGIRPAGAPDECFYCKQKVGAPHQLECVIVTKRVRLRYTYEVEVNVPHFWDEKMINVHRNELTWCADNGIDDLEKFANKRQKQGGCLCDGFRSEFLEIVDEKPRRKLNKDGLK